MDSLLIFAAEAPSLLATILSVAKTILLVLIGVNMLIIVHEWGHFVVARLCGVKCEKFYIWFDIFGWRICKFKWGETEYGLGVLPLGGYVKMLGQEDNPGRLREELERAKALQEQKGRIQSAQPAAAEEGGAEPIDIKAAEEALYDPRSYLAKSVPQRMAIISAGVIMNVVFAFIVAVIAYGIGVYKVDSEIGRIAPGGAAWRADLRVGDRVVEVAGNPITQFDQLREATMLGNIAHGVSIVIERPGASAPVRVVVEPDRDQPVPTIGIGGPNTTTLRQEDPTEFGTPAYRAQPQFAPGDQILAVDGQAVATGYEFHQREAMRRDKPISVTVRRHEKSAAAAKDLTIEVDPRPMRRLGLVMDAGPIAAVQANSPAARAGLKAGDVITAIDGQPLGDPLTLDDRLRRRFADPPAGPVTVALSLAKRAEPVPVELRLANWYELPLYGSEHTSVTSLGVTIDTKCSVAGVLESSPAAKAGIKPGDVVKTVTPIPPNDEVRKQLEIPDNLEQRGDTIDFARDGITWSSFFYSVLQSLLPGTRLKIELADGRTAELGWMEDQQWHHPDRGFSFEPKETFVRARSAGEAIADGVEETQNALMMVFKFLGKVGTRQVSARSVGGPITIVKIAYHYASSRFSDLLIFLCVISANLAVINFLPIPVLDGGHMVFLAYEGIRRKPPSEKVQIGLSYMGLFLLLALMVWVFGLDLGFIPRR